MVRPLGQTTAEAWQGAQASCCSRGLRPARQLALPQVLAPQLQCAAGRLPERQTVQQASSALGTVSSGAESRLLRHSEAPAELRPAYLQDHSGNGAGTPAPLRHSARRRVRLRVAVDVDEVLGRFLHSLNKFAHEEYGLEFDICDYEVYEFAKIWNCSKDESNRIVHQFFKSHHFAVGILPIPGALHSLQRLAATCDLVVVTSRQHCIRGPTLEWIKRHFPGVFAEVHFGNHWALEGQSKAKSEICRDIGASVLIDDNPRYAVECAEAGIDVLLYDWHLSYPWSKTADGPKHSRIRRVQDWTEVEDALAELALLSHQR